MRTVYRLYWSERPEEGAPWQDRHKDFPDYESLDAWWAAQLIELPQECVRQIAISEAVVSSEETQNPHPEG